MSRIDKRLDETEQHIKISDAKSDRLKSLNRFFMIPAFGSKAAKAKEESLSKKLAEQEERRIADGLREQERQERSGRIQGHLSHAARGSSAHGSHAHIYSTPEGLERDETENEIDSNLNQISSGLNRLKMMGRSMNDELGAQKDQLSRIQDRADSSRDRVGNLNRKMNSIANKR